jgi:rhodanese-related sulfurtransferase
MKSHSERFLKIVNDAKSRIKETDVKTVHDRLERDEDFFLVDVREESEYAAGHLPRALHMGKGVIERDIERGIPKSDAPIVLYCGGGYRSALAAENLQRMGYTNVVSMDGGYRGWREAGFPIVHEE